MWPNRLPCGVVSCVRIRSANTPARPNQPSAITASRVASALWSVEPTNAIRPRRGASVILTELMLTGATLRTNAPGVGANVKAVALNSNAGYCIEDNEGNGAWDYIGGNATPVGSAKLATIQSGTLTNRLANLLELVGTRIQLRSN